MARQQQDGRPIAHVSIYVVPERIAVVRDRADVNRAQPLAKVFQPDAPPPVAEVCSVRRFRHDEPDA